MAVPELRFSERATQITVNANLIPGGKLQVCLLQLAPSLRQVERDEGRPAAVASVQHLLLGGEPHLSPALSELIPGIDPVLIVAPEYAFGSSDWALLDAAIRQATRPLIFIGGFGASPGSVLLDWRDGAEINQTTRLLAWDQESRPIGRARRVNGGWIWIHEPYAETHCIVYLKTIAEQNVEAVQLADIQFGATVTHLRFNDVDIFPLICADMLLPLAGHPNSAQACIKEQLDSLGDSTRPAMIVGSLLQSGYNVNWEIAVDSMLNQVLADRPGLVVLCNIAHDAPASDEHRDRWRSLTGVYGKWDGLIHGQLNLPVGRRLSVRGVIGAVVRRTDPVIASGFVSWGPYGPVAGKYVWHAEMHCSCSQLGLVAPVTLPSTPHGSEIIRFCRRHPPNDGWAPRLKRGIGLISDHIVSGNSPSPAKLLNELIDGTQSKSIDPDDLHNLETAAKSGIYALATLIAVPGMDWQVQENQNGQIKRSDPACNILVWYDPKKSPGQMRAEINKWRMIPTPHPDLVVIGGSWLGDLEPGLVVERRRDDFATPPSKIRAGGLGSVNAERRDITVTRSRRRAGIVRMVDVAKIYADFSEDEGDDDAVATLIAAIDGLFEAAR